MKQHPDKHFREVAAPDTSNPDPGEDLGWLLRRRELLMRAIAEMEQHQRYPHLTDALLPDVPGLLAWARTELTSVEDQLRTSSGVLLPPAKKRTKSIIDTPLDEASPREG